MLILTDVGPRKPRRLPEGRVADPYERLELAPLTAVIGAEVVGFDLAQPIDDELGRELRRAFLEWKVLFFRHQQITAEDHRRFAAWWGELEVHPFLPQGDVPEIVRFERDETNVSYENIWHSDVSWREVPSLGSVLRAVEVPPVGGDTMWADMGAAYDGLPEDAKARIEGKRAVHDFTRTFGQLLAGEELRAMQEQYPAVEHPIVRTHPETGRKTIYVNRPFTSHVVGLSGDESDELLELLCRQADLPEYQCRFRWAPGSVAFWDNRATQHYAVSDYWPRRRVMERATVIGDQPF